jgi:hypothetical protein
MDLVADEPLYMVRLYYALACKTVSLTGFYECATDLTYVVVIGFLLLSY